MLPALYIKWVSLFLLLQIKWHIVTVQWSTAPENIYIGSLKCHLGECWILLEAYNMQHTGTGVVERNLIKYLATTPVPSFGLSFEGLLCLLHTGTPGTCSGLCPVPCFNPGSSQPSKHPQAWWRAHVLCFKTGQLGCQHPCRPLMVHVHRGVFGHKGSHHLPASDAWACN